MTIIIFGISGQDGHYLSSIFNSQGIEVIGVSRSSHPVQADIANYTQVEQLIKKYKPTYIFHLAANSTTRHDALFENHETISTGTLNILESAKKHCPNTKIFITGSGVQFQNQGKQISETDPFESSSPYAIARIQSVYAARYYRKLGMKVYVGYLFHHESPLRKPNHVSKMIALAAQRIGNGTQETIELGNISVEKEWTFAGDVAQGIFTLVQQDEVFEATIGSGVTYSIENWLELCFSLVNRNWYNYVKIRENFIPEYHRLVSNPQTINSLGWQPKISFSELCSMMMNMKALDYLDNV